MTVLYIVLCTSISCVVIICRFISKCKIRTFPSISAKEQQTSVLEKSYSNEFETSIMRNPAVSSRGKPATDESYPTTLEWQHAGQQVGKL